MKKILYTLFLVNIFFQIQDCHAVNDIDSLKQIWENKAVEDTSRLKSAEILFWKNIQVNTDSANILAQNILQFAQDNNLRKWEAKAYEFMAVCASGDLEYYQKSLTIYEEIGSFELTFVPLSNMGRFARLKGDYLSSIDYYTKLLIYSEKVDDQEWIASAMTSLGSIYLDFNDYENALKYLKKSIKINENLKQIQLFNPLNILGDIYKQKGNLQKAHEYYKRGLEIANEENITSYIATSTSRIGAVYQLKGEYAKALEHYSISLKISEEGNFGNLIAKALYNIGHIHYILNNNERAESFALRSNEKSKKQEYLHNLKNTTNLLYQVYKKQNRQNKALNMYEQFIILRDSINKVENQKAAMKNKFQYEYEKKEAINEAEYKKNMKIQQAISNADKRQQKLITAAVSSGLGLVVLFSIFLFNRFIIIKKQKVLIEKQKVKVEKQKGVIEETHKEITDSIAYAKRIQSAILPPSRIVKEFLKDSFILYKPKDVVAGDFYWMEQVEGKTLFAAADCTGHGVPGAMVSVVCNNALNRSVREYGLTEPGQILDKTREIVIQEFEKSDEEVKDGMDVALCSLEGNKLRYAGANNPLWIIRNGEVLETKANKQPIGKFDNPMPYNTHSLELEKGDVFYIFSDGYPDQFGGPKGKKLKSKAFKELLLSMQDKPMEVQKKLIDQQFERWKGELEQIDDVCVIGVRI